MKMLIDGSWTTASDGGIDRVFNRAAGRQFDVVRRAKSRTVSAARHGASAFGALPGWRRYKILGGNKASGNGCEGIHHTLLEMTREKTLLLHEVFELAV